jgi:hypothetical protein
MFRLNFGNSFLNDVLLTLAVIKQAKFFICNSSGKFQNDLGGQDLMLATVHDQQKKKTWTAMENKTSENVGPVSFLLITFIYIF